MAARDAHTLYAYCTCGDALTVQASRHRPRHRLPGTPPAADHHTERQLTTMDTPTTVAPPRLIENTHEPMRHPWPDDSEVQGGSRGVVIKREGGAYRTAFVEAFVDGTFLRGEGPTIADAEDACWAQYEHLRACPTYPKHGPFDRRSYRNGSGYCTGCGGWFPGAITGLPELPEDPDEEPSLMARALTGDLAAAEAVMLVANVDDLPAAPGVAP